MVKKYIIMCGGDYSTYWNKPRQLSVVNGEVLVERTIRLLKENGIKDISISTNTTDFDYLDVPILKHENSYRTEGKEVKGYWCEAFYPTNKPVCYIFGDVYFSDEAIKTIVETDTDDIEFFGSKPPFAKNYPKNHVEPFALKVVNVDHLKDSIKITKQYEDEGKFWRKPLMWELWTVIKNVPLQKSKDDDYIYNYVAINDYTSDIDREKDIKKLEYMIGGMKMVRLEVIEEFTLGRYSELENIERNGKNEIGRLYVGDKFDCNEELADYITGNNSFKKPFAKVIGIMNEEKNNSKKESKIEEKPKNKKPKKSKK